MERAGHPQLAARSESARWQTLYQSSQALVGGDVDQTATLFGSAAFASDSYVHNVSGTYRFTNELRVYGGVNNVTDRDPFITSASWPVGPRGRYFFLGAQMEM